MQLPVPYFSQYSDIADSYWRERSCSIACVKMTLDFLLIQTPSLLNLVTESAELFGYDPSLGWKHSALVKVFEKYGYEDDMLNFMLLLSFDYLYLTHKCICEYLENNGIISEININELKKLIF